MKILIQLLGYFFLYAAIGFLVGGFGGAMIASFAFAVGGEDVNLGASFGFPIGGVIGSVLCSFSSLLIRSIPKETVILYLGIGTFVPAFLFALVPEYGVPLSMFGAVFGFLVGLVFLYFKCCIDSNINS